ERTEVPDVDVAVHGRAAGVDLHGLAVHRLDLVDLPRQRVVETHRKSITRHGSGSVPPATLRPWIGILAFRPRNGSWPDWPGGGPKTAPHPPRPPTKRRRSSRASCSASSARWAWPGSPTRSASAAAGSPPWRTSLSSRRS